MDDANRLAGAGRLEPLAWAVALDGQPGVVPPFPGVDVVKMARVPPPPKLQANATDKELASALALAYIGAVQAKYKLRAYALDPRKPERSKYYEQLVECATALVGCNAAPAAWALWSCDVWREFFLDDGADPTRPPSAKWVWLPTRVLEHYNWFCHSGAARLGGQVHVGERHRALLVQWEAMKVAILRGEDVAVAVGRFFPGDTYAKLVQGAQREADRTQRMIDEEIALGHFLWR